VSTCGENTAKTHQIGGGLSYCVLSRTLAFQRAFMCESEGTQNLYALNPHI